MGEETSVFELIVYFVGSIAVTLLCGGGGVEVAIVLLFFFLSISWKGSGSRASRGPAAILYDYCCCCCPRAFCGCCHDEDRYVFDYPYDSEDASSLGSGSDVDER